jgi:hypothetical protein
VVLSISGALQQSVQGLQARASSENTRLRVVFYALEYTPFLGLSYIVAKDYPIMGNGVGFAQHAATRFLNRRIDFISQEFEGCIVAEEIGAPGLLSYYVFRIGLVCMAVAALRSARRNVDYLVAATIAGALFANFTRTCVADPFNFISTALLVGTSVAIGRTRS